MANIVDITDDTRSLHALGEFIRAYEPRQNAFLSALVNRIGRVIVTARMWDNPWASLKKGYMDLGETVEEIFVNIGKVYSFNPEEAETKLYKREIPDVRGAFHTMNYQKYYPVTISEEQLQQAFLSWQGITDLVAYIVDSLYKAANYDEFLVMKYMICRQALNGAVNSESFITGKTASQMTSSDLKTLIESVRTYSNNMEILSNKYNSARVYNATPKNQQYIIMENAIEAKTDVEVLASAFHMEKTEFIGHLLKLDSFSDHDSERLALIFENDPDYVPFTGTEILKLQKIAAILLDQNWFMVFDNFQQIRQNPNGLGLSWNYFLHCWKTFSTSPYANVVAFYTDSVEIEDITVTPSTATVAQGKDLAFSASVTGTGLIDKSVAWSISGQTKSGTHINANSGLLHVSSDEPANTVITVKATAVDGQSDSASVTVVASGGSATNDARFRSFSVKDKSSTPLVGEGLIDDAAGTITVTMPSGSTAVTALIAEFTVCTGAVVKIGSTTQTSGVTENNFTNPVNYLVYAADGTTIKQYTVTVTIAS